MNNFQFVISLLDKTMSRPKVAPSLTLNTLKQIFKPKVYFGPELSPLCQFFPFFPQIILPPEIIYVVEGMNCVGGLVYLFFPLKEWWGTRTESPEAQFSEVF